MPLKSLSKFSFDFVYRGIKQIADVCSHITKNDWIWSFLDWCFSLVTGRTSNWLPLIYAFGKICLKNTFSVLDHPCFGIWVWKMWYKRLNKLPSLFPCFCFWNHNFGLSTFQFLSGLIWQILLINSADLSFSILQYIQVEAAL